MKKRPFKRYAPWQLLTMTYGYSKFGVGWKATISPRIQVIPMATVKINTVWGRVAWFWKVVELPCDTEKKSHSLLRKFTYHMSSCKIILASLQSSRNFGEQVLYIFLVKIKAAILCFLQQRKAKAIRRDKNLYQGGGWRSKGRRGRGGEIDICTCWFLATTVRVKAMVTNRSDDKTGVTSA